eukprot:Amastigsp_a82_1328.p3 type:complete len:105 gc:universal Amastigsp_a82_1328:265-579(+)
MPSSASMEQCRLTGGSARNFAMSEFLIACASSSVLPITHSVASDDDAIAEPQPKVLKTACTILPVAGSTSTWNFIMSPHAGAPTVPVPTFFALRSSEPTLRGFS